MSDPPLRVLLAKVGLDGHDRGLRVVARILRDHGFEVVFAGLRQTPEMIVAIAIQEDVDLIGLSMLAGSHLEYSEEVIKELEERGAADIQVIVGGIIPEEDVEALLRIGVKASFGPGSSITTIAKTVKDLVGRRGVGV